LWNRHRKKILALISSLALALLAVVAGLVYFLSSQDFERLAADHLVRVIGDRTGMEVTLDAFEIDLERQRLALIGLVMRGTESESDPPLLSVDRVDVGFGWRAILRRRIDVTYVDVLRPQFQIQIRENGETNFPPLPAQSGGPSGFELSIGDLSVSEGLLVFAEQRIDVDFRLSALEGRFDYIEATRALSGHIEYSGAVSLESLQEIPYSFAADFDYVGGTALVRSMAVQSGRSSLRLQGRVDQVLGRRNGGLEYTGEVDLPFLNYFLPGEEFDGTMAVAGALDFSTTHFATAGNMRSESLGFGDWTAGDISSGYEYAFPERVLEADGFDAGVFGGRAVGDLRVSPLPGSPRVEMDIRFRNVDTAALRSLYPWDPRYVIRSRANGTMTGWFDGAFSDFDLSGTATLGAVPVPPSPALVNLSVSGSTAYHGTPGQVSVDGLRGRLGSTTVEASGVVRAEDFSLDVSLASDDLRDLAFVYAAANGAGDFQGTLEGRLIQPDAGGTFTLNGHDYDGWVIDRIAGGIEFRSGVVTLEGVQVLEGTSDLTMNGTFDLNTGEPDLDIRILRLASEEVTRFISQPIGGEFSGEVHVESIAPLVAAGRVQSPDFTFGLRALGTVEADVAVAPDRIQVRNARVRQEQSILAGTLDYEPGTEAVRLEIEASGQQVGDLVWLGVPQGFQGLIRSASFVVEGTPTNPLIEGRAVVEDLQFRNQFFPEAVIDVENSGRVVSAQVGAGTELELSLRLDTFAEGYPFEGTARFTGYDAARLTGMETGTVTATGTASFDGRLDDLSTLAGSGEVLALTARLDDQELVVERPFTFEFDTDQVRVSSIDLSDETTTIAVEGTVSLSPEVPLNLTVIGEVDLSLIAGNDVSVDVAGNLSIEGEITGNLEDPELRGIATLTEVSVQHPGVLLSLTGLSGDLFFDGNSVNVIDLQGVAGGGNVAIEGTIAVDGMGPGAMNLLVDATNVRVRTPQGLRTVFDGALTLRGTADAPILEGNINVVSLSFAESFEDFLTLFGQAGVNTASGPLDELVLALHIEGEDDIRVQNELVSVAARLDLDVAGTFGEPTMVGRVESTDGTLNLQGARYVVTRGNVDFVDPVGIEPFIDIQAETEVRDYRVILTITGPASEPRLEMRSDPPLPQLEIVSLIAGGRTREELADGTNAAPTGEELFQGAAATILTDLLQERVGSRFGLGTRVRIDPFLVGAENDPVARLTISEQITRDLTITYSQDLASNRQEVILIEYFLGNNTSFIASRDETGAVGLDIKLRKRFR
jgi:translocation and assembly module TamB